MIFLGQQFGNYHVERELDHGGFGTVYLARHTLLTDRLVAIKVLHDVHLQTPAERDAFLQEAWFLDQLKHPYILPLLDVGIHEGTFPYLMMEYAASGSLRKRLNSQSSHLLPFDESLTILLQIGQALQYAHQQTPAIIHRDLKPDNILFNQRGEALLADFGIATVLSTASIRYTNPVGTVAYMAPEQFLGQVSRECDQYALGCVAYELLTGQRPFTAPNFIAMGVKHANEEPIPPRQCNPNLPAHVEDAVLKALAKQREDRHADVAAFLAVLQRPLVSHINLHSRTEFSRDQLRSHLLSLLSLRIASLKASSYQVPEELDPKAVWARIQRHDVPSTWHVFQTTSAGAGCMGAIIGGFVPFALACLVVQLIFGSLSSDSIPSFVGIVVFSLTGIGMILGGGWGKRSASGEANKLTLMPDGFIYFSPQGVPRHIISYKAVEDIRFDSIKQSLVVTTSWSGAPKDDRKRLGGPIDIRGFNAAPRIIAQRVERAYTSFKGLPTFLPPQIPAKGLARFKARNNLP
ncbi:serine/threonine protein kinase [Ktedonobacteria bacterium brp13]|nr:serine/threonine protein kinase [Ktedonobacteria bacterium brp13]